MLKTKVNICYLPGGHSLRVAQPYCSDPGILMRLSQHVGWDHPQMEAGPGRFASKTAHLHAWQVGGVVGRGLSFPCAGLSFVQLHFPCDTAAGFVQSEQTQRGERVEAMNFITLPRKSHSVTSSIFYCQTDQSYHSLWEGTM